MAFIEAIPPLEVSELLTKRQSAIQQELLKLENARGHSHQHGGLILILEHQEIHLNAEIEWLKK